MTTKEQQRLQQPFNTPVAPWRKWGPYVSERAWGTVREDYSTDGNAWDYFPHDLARSKAYRWGEDGLAGICDRYQIMCFALALWNGRDPILKERLYGLVSSEANHGEDVKEYYFYLDSTPTHSYMKYLYKYPQSEFPYGKLIHENRARRGQGGEYELLDTGVFDDDRYFDVFVEYAKATPEDIVMRIEVCNRGPEAAPIHVLPHLWFRNTWAWWSEPTSEPVIRRGPSGECWQSLEATDGTAEPLPNLPFKYQLGTRYLYA
ncbi:MAG: MGH1-like glycoside hydrolase domain-containing protein, partial [Pyrinomonadaceae bacterium]